MSPGELIDGDTQVVQITEPGDIQLNSGDTPRRGARLPNFVTCHKPRVKPGEEKTGAPRGRGKARRERIRDSRMHTGGREKGERTLRKGGKGSKMSERNQRKNGRREE